MPLAVGDFNGRSDIDFRFPGHDGTINDFSVYDLDLGLDFLLRDREDISSFLEGAERN